MNFVKFDDSSSVSGSTVTTGKYSFRKREIILAVIAVVALVLVIVLGIVLAVKPGKSTSDCQSETQAQTGAATSSTSQQSQGKICETYECIKLAAYQMPIVKKSTDHCQDFYTFACGNYAQLHRKTPQMLEVSPSREISDYNKHRLEMLMKPEIIESEPADADTEPDYQHKLKLFMQSCNSHFDKMNVGGIPFIDKVIQPMGGWWLFDDNVINSFDLQKSFITASVDFLAGTFVHISISSNNNDIFKNIVQIHYGSSLLHAIYAESQYPLFAVQEEYKRYMQLLAAKLCSDHGVTCDQENIVQFSEDAFEVEDLLIQHEYSFGVNPLYHEEDQLWTIGELNSFMNSTINFLDYFKGVFNEYPSKFDESTKIAVQNPEFFRVLGNSLETYLNNGTTGKRKLHNYMIWTLITKFSSHLSWDYVHAEINLFSELTGSPTDITLSDYCFHLGTNSYFRDAMNAFYVDKMVPQAAKEEAQNMKDEIKAILEDAVKNLKWMSKANQDYGVRKIQNSLYKIGFPDRTMDMNYMNTKYSFVTVDSSDYFGNVLNLIRGFKHHFNMIFQKGSFREEWPLSLFEPVVLYDNPWQDFILTSAVLQDPLYHHNGPAFYNLATVGAAIASNLVHAVDQAGSEFGIGGSHSGSWWDQSTTEQFKSYRNCAARVWGSSDPGPFSIVIDGNVIPVPSVSVNRNTTGWTSQLLAASAGIQMALKAYKDRVAKMGPELSQPGLSEYTAEQMFFISYAQSKCQNAPDLWKYYQVVTQGIAPSKEMVNLALAQVPEFQAAFNCPAVNNQPEPCQLFEL